MAGLSSAYNPDTMLVSVFISFGHFFSVFALSAALVLQLALISDSISVDTAVRIQRADRAYGIAAALVLLFGLLRVFLFDRGADYYFSNTFFLLKMGLLVSVGLLSIYPTVSYLRWNQALNSGEAPEITPQSALRLRRLIHYQLIGIGGILLCASLVARGYGA
ncbi:MAG: DUF2214 family protein [Gammaproteobacteria bacterium]